MRKVSQRNWQPHDPTWLIELAKAQDPIDTSLTAALELCMKARRRTCCAPRICGYDFVESDRPNAPDSHWQFARSTILLNHRHVNGVGDVVVDLLKDGRVGGVEFL